MAVAFGTDPEFLLVTEKGEPFPAHRAGIRDKTKKHKSSDGAFFRDGYMVEINIVPTDCRQSAAYRVQRQLFAILKYVRAKNLRLVAQDAVEIDLAKDMRNAPADVRQFGCEPSFCAYEGAAKIPPIDAITHPYRYAGAHLHFSATMEYTYSNVRWNPECLRQPALYPEIIKVLDQYVGLPLTCLMHSDEQYQRRQFYGQAGEYRPQHYGERIVYQVPKSIRVEEIGLEYRTPGARLWNAPWLTSLILGISRAVIEEFPRFRKTLNDKRRVAAVRHAINTGEERWRLLKPIKCDGVWITPTTWRWLYLQFSRLPAEPMLMLEGGADPIDDGFADWYRARHRK